MALRRGQAILALLLAALLHACAAQHDPSPPRARAARAAPHYDDEYSSEAPFDPFAAWDYDSSEERGLTRLATSAPKPKPNPTRRPNPKPTPRRKVTDPPPAKPKSSPRPNPKASPRPKIKENTKVTVSAKVPKVTVKTKNSANRRNVMKTTTVDIESFTRFVVTPSSRPERERRPQQTTKRPKEASGGAGKLAGNKAPKNRQGVTSRPNSAGKQPTRRTTRRPPPTTNKTSRKTPRPSRAPPPPPRTTRPPPSRAPPPRPAPPPRRPARSTTTRRPGGIQAQKKTDQCSSKDPGWISSFFQANHKIAMKQEMTKPGILNKVYSWLGWGGGGGDDGGEGSDGPGTTWLPSWQLTTTTTTTTSTAAPPPAPAADGNWFYSLLNAEEDDGAYAPPNVTDKNPRKSLRKKYSGFQLLRTYPEAAWKVVELLELQEETRGSGLMWWTSPSVNCSTDILVPPDLLPDVKDHLSSLGLEYDVVIWDLQKAIQYENPKLSKKQRVELEQLRGHPLTWRRYHRYADILRYLEYLQHSHPDLVELVPLGRSSEGLPLVAVKVSFPSNETATVRASSGGGGGGGGKKRWRLRSRMKPAVWVEAGAHAREWIAPAAATWMLHALVEGDRGLGEDYEMLKAADWYIAPLLNPDGYEHSHTHDRLWRKTRSQHTRDDTYYNSWFPWNWGNTDCMGVDLERNYDFHWGEKGASKDPCSEQYAGPHPFSEPETRAVSQFLLEHKERIKVYVSLHAYSQMWLVPSTHSRVPFPDDGEVLEMGRLATAALADLFGTKYQVGTMADLAQPATGASFEWAKGRAGIKYSYNVKMRDAQGPYGFLLPDSQIVPTAKETWAAIRTIVENL